MPNTIEDWESGDSPSTAGYNGATGAFNTSQNTTLNGQYLLRGPTSESPSNIYYPGITLSDSFKTTSILRLEGSGNEIGVSLTIASQTSKYVTASCTGDNLYIKEYDGGLSSLTSTSVNGPITSPGSITLERSGGKLTATLEIDNATEGSVTVNTPSAFTGDLHPGLFGIQDSFNPDGYLDDHTYELVESTNDISEIVSVSSTASVSMVDGFGEVFWGHESDWDALASESGVSHPAGELSGGDGGEAVTDKKQF